MPSRVKAAFLQRIGLCLVRLINLKINYMESMQNLFETLLELYEIPATLDEMHQIHMAIEKDKEALSITDVSASKQRVKCANCSREIESYKDACASCRIADALLD